MRSGVDAEECGDSVIMVLLFADELVVNGSLTVADGDSGEGIIILTTNLI